MWSMRCDESLKYHLFSNVNGVVERPFGQAQFGSLLIS